MSTAQLKKEIIDKLSTISDEQVLKEIHKMLTLEAGLESAYPLTDAERTAILKGLQDAEENRLYSSEVAEQMIKQWLKK